MTIPYAAFLKAISAAVTVVDKTWGDLITASKSTSLKVVRAFTRAKSATIYETWNLTQTARSSVDKVWSDGVSASKTTNLNQVNYPKDLSANVLDAPDCPDTELTWDVGTYTSYSMTLQRRTNSVWSTVSSSIPAGTEYYLDTGVTEGDTDGWRIMFNGLSGADWTTITGVNTICPF